MTHPTTRAKLHTLVRQRDAMRLVLDRLTDADLTRLVDRARGAARDGFPASSGGSLGGGGVSRPVERAAMAGLPDEGADDWQAHDMADPVGDSLAGFVVAMVHASGELAIVERQMAYVLSVGDSLRGRGLPTTGTCEACGRMVACNATDPMRAGFCNACRMAWARVAKAWAGAGAPDRAVFVRTRPRWDA